MMTDASTATRIKATLVRQTERIIRDVGDSGTTNPSSSSRSGQHKRVRFSDQEHLESKPDTGNSDWWPGGTRDAQEIRRNDAERLEEETAETAQADATCRFETQGRE